MSNRTSPAWPGPEALRRVQAVGQSRHFSHRLADLRTAIHQHEGDPGRAGRPGGNLFRSSRLRSPSSSMVPSHSKTSPRHPPAAQEPPTPLQARRCRSHRAVSSQLRRGCVRPAPSPAQCQPPRSNKSRLRALWRPSTRAGGDRPSSNWSPLMFRSDSTVCQAHEALAVDRQGSRTHRRESPRSPADAAQP